MFIVWNPKQASATQLEDEICSASEKGPLKQKLKRQHSIWNINWNRFFFIIHRPLQKMKQKLKQCSLQTYQVPMRKWRTETETGTTFLQRLTIRV